ncbi:hypothetical protein AVDCRST_MAG92-5410 [uncultured Coleofasciculus sp.]|uniref:Uncharacterized protein n=1 Tax=uncultured Coleofasciculus sp. TaxID=1267456 RepID=A0A6J4KGH7_9CYAN|nr:hypothetical protein AVDCRST_MAG92-5410 [uncultured Coleofasciculus sp.]
MSLIAIEALLKSNSNSKRKHKRNCGDSRHLQELSQAQ